MKLFGLILTLVATAVTPSRAGAPTLVYSPDQAFVVAWFDTDSSPPVGQTRSILIKPSPEGDPVFTLVTFPRYTLAYWSPDSKKCILVNAPDDGNSDTWIFIADKAYAKFEQGEEGPPCTVPVYPLKALQNYQYKHSDHLWRGGITSGTWQNNETFEFHASDNNGTYNIFLKLADLNHPVIKKLK